MEIFGDFADDLIEEAVSARTQRRWVSNQCDEDVSALVSILNDATDSKECCVAAASLAELAVSRKYSDPLREAGAIPALTALISIDGRPLSQEDNIGRLEVATNAATALRNLACPSHPNREAIRLAGAIPFLIALLYLDDFTVETRDSKTDVCRSCVRAACGALRNLSHSNVANCIAIREAGGFPALARYITDPPAAVGSPGREAAFRAGSTLCNLCCGCPENVSALWETGMVPRLVALLAQPGGSGFWHPGFINIVEYGQAHGWLPSDLKEERWAERKSAERNSRRAIRRLQCAHLGAADAWTEVMLSTAEEGDSEGVYMEWDAQRHAWVKPGQ